jgi:hypothetical protein
MKRVQRVYQIVFVMFDGAELAWKLFRKLEHYEAYVDYVGPECMRKLGIRAIQYRMRYIDE